jgi:hypothetical protein
MIREKFIGLAFWLFALWNGIPPENPAFAHGKHHWQLRRSGFTTVAESSGLAHADSLLLTHSDSGHPPVLYLIHPEGEVVDAYPFPMLSHTDWEDLAQDHAGNIYIGDFGNNLNTRTNLAIHKVSAEMKPLGTLHFSFADQHAFPPPSRERNFDMEAFFWAEGQLYLFSKNRGNRCVRVYILPDSPGEYSVEPRYQIYLRAPITAADFHPTTGTIALLGYGKLYLLHYRSGEPPMPIEKIALKRTGQAESVLWLNDSTLLIGNEKGKLWTLSRKKL